jgi:flagellar hook-length control protein FliK
MILCPSLKQKLNNARIQNFSYTILHESLQKQKQKQQNKFKKVKAI